jgi:hypothetical protein
MQTFTRRPKLASRMRNACQSSVRKSSSGVRNSDSAVSRDNRSPRSEASATLESDDSRCLTSFIRGRSAFEIAPQAIRQALPIKRRLD